MIKLVCNHIPFKGFTAITLYPFVIVRKDSVGLFTWIVENHERIHGEQQKEMLVLLFYLWYLIEYLVKWVYYRNRMTAYKNISFEREAYENQSNSSYLDTRKRYSWVKYIKQ